MSDDIVREFLVESAENLDLLDRELVLLEKNPEDRGTLASIFRTIHTIKGTCGFLGFPRLESVAHVGENLLSRLRDGELALNPEITTALLRMVDAIRQMLESVEAVGSEGERDDEDLIKTLTELQQGTSQTAAEGKPPAAVLSSERREDPHEQEAQADRSDVHAHEGAETSQAQSASRSGTSEASIRVDVGLLDKLMNLVGELVLARNQILQFTNTTGDAGLSATSQRLNLITTELQEGVMKTRMQPIGNIWSKFPRTVRDVATACGKQIRIEMEGKETELDKTIIEAIKDPLTHIVRNSADHGIEPPAKRVAVGKSAEGRLLLRAFHEGGQVNIEITDDGAGLDAEKIRRKALEKGLITAEQAAKMGERDCINLIFLPGFSTAEKVTNVSGRGVGMDVVKTNIEKIGGTVDVQSKAGVGTTVRMKIPLTLAIIPALIVTSGGDRYAIPQISLLELVRLEGEDALKGIELIQGIPVYRLRGRLLPLVYLNRELKVERSSEETVTEAAIRIVVLQADERQFGLVVDEINDTEEIVVKPLGKQLKGIKAFAGSTIMGDGRVALILDVLGVAQTSNVVSESRERAIADKDTQVAAVSSQKQTMLLFQYGANGRMAMDLSLVARLEEFKPEIIERAGDCQVVQYRGQIMPLIRVSEVLRAQNGARTDDSKPIQVVVYSEQGRSVGLVVDRILDIVEETFVPQQPSRRAGLLGSAVIQKRVTDLLDVRGLVCTANPTFFENQPAMQER
jgi:two-component system, chemotaxis family, sensor kinase CheA